MLMLRPAVAVMVPAPWASMKESVSIVISRPAVSTRLPPPKMLPTELVPGFPAKRSWPAVTVTVPPVETMEPTKGGVNTPLLEAARMFAPAPVAVTVTLAGP